MAASYAVLSSRLAWLMACRGKTRNRIADLLGRISGLGMPGAMKPSLFRKFLDMLDEVGAAREEEYGLIARIEEVEQKHRFLRDHKKLKAAVPRAQAAFAAGPAEIRQPSPERSFFEMLLFLILWLIVLWNMFFWEEEINQKKQGVTGLKPIFTPFPLP